MSDQPACPDRSSWATLSLGAHEVLVHRAAVTTIGGRGVRTADRHDWFRGAAGEDRWVVFHRSEHPDATTAATVLERGARDHAWQAQLVGRRRAELEAAPIAVADLQRTTLRALAHRSSVRLRAALPEELAEVAGLAPDPGERPVAPDDLPPLVVTIPADPAAGVTRLSDVLPAPAACALGRHGLTTLGDVARLTDRQLRGLPGVGPDARTAATEALARHGLLPAPDRSSPAALRDRRDGRRRQAARFAELRRRGYEVQQIAEHVRRSAGYVRMLLGEQTG